MDDSPTMSLVYKESVWRVRIVWPKHRQRFFGKFALKAKRSDGSLSTNG
jgi:hypothetical protein